MGVGGAPRSGVRAAGTEGAAVPAAPERLASPPHPPPLPRGGREIAAGPVTTQGINTKVITSRDQNKCL